jgi:hypothetical protein
LNVYESTLLKYILTADWNFNYKLSGEFMSNDNSQLQKILVCENCLYYDSISEFKAARRFCTDCLCDHFSCPICKSSYHAVQMSD